MNFFESILGANRVLATSNLIVVGGQSKLPGHSFGSLPWQVNIVPLVIILVGAVHLFCPRFCWWCKWGWRFADSEPSTMWLFFERLGGVIIIAIGIYIFCMLNGIIPHPG